MKKVTKKVVSEKQVVPSKQVNLLVSVKPDENLFLPISDGNGGFELKASQISDQMTITSRSSAILDCGVVINKPVGVRVVVEVAGELAKKGLLLSVANVTGNRLMVVACNAGRQILAFSHGETIGSYYFIETAKAAVKVN